jgi:hypothetical protein
VLNKKTIIIVSVLSIVVIGVVFILLEPKQEISEEAQVHLDNIYSLSGKLTPEEKQVYFENAFALEKLSVQHGHLPEKEMDKMRYHLQALIIKNPDLMLSAQEYDQRYGHILGHTHGHPHGEDLHQETQQALEQVNAAIAELEASDVPEGVKESLRSILNLRRETLLVPESEIDELKKVYIEFLKNDPEVSGVMKDPRTGEYIPSYPNMVIVYRRRTHHVNGTVEDIVTGISTSANTPENQEVIEAYETALDMTPPSETPPAPPEIEGLRFSVEYEDVYLNSEKEVITDKTDQPMDGVTSPPTSDVPATQVEQPKVEEVWTEITDDVFLLQDSLKDIDNPQTQSEITIFLEEALGVPFDRFLEMSDAEIEEELRKIFAPSDAEIEAKFKDLLTPHHPPMLDTTTFESNLESSLSKKFSMLRAKRAIATINQRGPKEGLRRLKEVDPEVAKQLESYLQKQEGGN